MSSRLSSSIVDRATPEFSSLNNAFSTKFFPKVGGFGPATDCGGEVQSGNVYHETGEPFTLGE